MKQFLSFVRKEFYHILRDKRTMLIIIGIPVIQILLFGFAITTEVKNVKVAVYDPSQDISTQRIINQIDASEYFNVALMIDNPNEIQRIYEHDSDINLIIVFAERFNEDLMHHGKASVQLIADATDPNQAVSITGYATNIILAYQQELIQNQELPMLIVPEVRMLYNPQIKSAYNFVPGVMGLITILICAMMTSISIVREKEVGTMEVLLASPVKPLYIILSKAVPYLVISIFNMLVILLLSVYVLGVPISGGIGGLALISFIYILVALALGLLISSVAKNQVEAIIVSGMGLMMPIMLLSGMIYPVESMPTILQYVSHIIPAKWYIMAIKKLMIQGLDISSVVKELIILIVMAVGLLTISFKKFNIRLK